MTVTRTHTYPEGTPPGVYTITATDGVNTATAQITILDSTPSTVAVDPTVVGPGETVTVTGSGFPPSTGGTVEIVPAGGGAAVGTASFTTDDTGAMPSTVVPVDAGAAPGDYTVNVQVGLAGGEAELTVAAPLPAPAGLASPGSTEDTVELTWEAVSGANQYQVEYREEGATTWTAGPSGAATTASVTGLESGVTYEFRVIARDTTGVRADSAPSDPIQVSTTAPLPQLAFPDNVAATPVGTTGLMVTWDERPGAVGYVVHYREQGATTWTPLPQTTETSQDITDLALVTVYEVQVQAVGDDTTNTSSVFGPTPPVEQSTASEQMPVPTGLVAVGMSTTSVTLTWDAVPEATAYRVQSKTEDEPEWNTWSPDATAPGGTVSGLTEGETYEFRVKTLGDGTTQADSDYTEPVTMNTVQLATPADVNSPAQTDTTIEVAWSEVVNAQGYGVEWSPAGAGDWTGDDTTTTGYTITTLEPGTEYDVRVTALAATYVASEPSAVSTFSTLAPLAAPTNLAASGETATSIDLDWDAVADATVYHVQYQETGSGTWLDWEPDPANNAVTVEGLTTATSYDFQVMAVGDGTTNVDSPYSAVVTASTT